MSVVELNVEIVCTYSYHGHMIVLAARSVGNVKKFDGISTNPT